tara:strand:- start:54 stop:326 length:273 start_codon:yes stop_codon:yes gene_type:complete
MHSIKIGNGSAVTFDSDSTSLELKVMEMRAERNSRLADTDMWATADRKMTADQTAYRKALRDLPANSNPALVDEKTDHNLTGVTWPTKPE